MLTTRNQSQRIGRAREVSFRALRVQRPLYITSIKSVVLLIAFFVYSLSAAAQTATYDPIAYGATCNGKVDDSAAFSKIFNIAAGTPVKIRLPRSQLCSLADLKFPGNISVDFSDARGFNIVKGATVVIEGPLIAKPVQIFHNAFPGQGTVLFSGSRVQTFYPEWWGAIGDESTDSTAPIIAAVAGLPTTGGRLVFSARKTYRVSDRIILKSNLTIDGYGATIDASDIHSQNDTFLIQGSNSPGLEAHDITISGLTMINNVKQYQIDVFGWSFAYHPHHIRIRDINTSGSSATGPLYVNIGSYVWFENCVNRGGIQHIGVEAPPKQPGLTHHIWITGNRTTATTQFGYQVVYGTNYSIENNKVDGSDMRGGDQTGITLDRLTNALVKGNQIDNCPVANIFVTGSDDVTITENTLSGGGSGINVSFNWEDKLDNTINESHRITISNNIVKSFSPKHNGIVLNGVQDSSITGNTVASAAEPNVGVLVMDGKRPGDNRPMSSTNITFADNTVGGTAQFAVASPAKVGTNRVGRYSGVPGRDR